jgi:hypothetical protein
MTPQISYLHGGNQPWRSMFSGEGCTSCIARGRSSGLQLSRLLGSVGLSDHDRLPAKCARGFRENVVGLRTDQPDGANHDDQDDGQHHRVFGDVLTFVIEPYLVQKGCHVCAPFRSLWPEAIEAAQSYQEQFG